MGARGGIRPVLLSISKSFAANVVAYTPPLPAATKESGRRGFNKCLAGSVDLVGMTVAVIVLELRRRCWFEVACSGVELQSRARCSIYTAFEQQGVL